MLIGLFVSFIVLASYSSLIYFYYINPELANKLYWGLLGISSIPALIGFALVVSKQG
jgi:hypothetical protein